MNSIFSWEMFPGDVMLSVGETDAQVLEHIKRSGYKVDAEEKEALEMRHSAGRTVVLHGGQIILRLGHWKDDIWHTGLLTHEAYHAVDFLMDHVGIKHSDDSDEAFAYAIQWLMCQCLQRLKKGKHK